MQSHDQEFFVRNCTPVRVQAMFLGVFPIQAASRYAKQFLWNIPDSANTYSHQAGLSIFRISGRQWLFVADLVYSGILPQKNSLFFDDANFLDQSSSYSVFDIAKTYFCDTIRNNCNIDVQPLIDNEHYFIKSRIGDFPALMINRDLLTVRIFIPGSYSRSFEHYLSQG